MASHRKCTVNLSEKMNFGCSNTEIGRKMADGQLLFLALQPAITAISWPPPWISLLFFFTMLFLGAAHFFTAGFFWIRFTSFCNYKLQGETNLV